MADKYVRSTDGSNADDGSTWALAKLDLHTATTGGIESAGAGSKVYVSDNHAGSYTAKIFYPTVGTLASPTQIICVDDSAEPPTAVALTATETTNAGGFSWLGAQYWYGIAFIYSGGSTGVLEFANGYIGPFAQTFDNCKFDLGTGSAGGPRTGNQGATTNDKGCKTILRECTLKLPNATGASWLVYNTDLLWHGGSVLTNTNLPTHLFTLQTGPFNATLRIVGVDLSVLSGKTLVNAGNSAAGADIKFINCKLPASVTLSTSPQHPGQRIAIYGSDSGDTNYRMEIQTYAGSISSETTIVRTGGAGANSGLFNGATELDAFSWKMVSSANAEYPLITLDTDEIVQWNETTGSAITVTVEIITDNVTLTDAECWLEVQYLGTSGFPLSVFISDAKADVLATAANQTTSSETWTTTGLTTPVKQKLAVTFTPQEKGFIHAVLKLAKASTTVYVDPKLTVA